MKQKGFLIALVALVGIMFIIPLKHTLADYSKCLTHIEECGVACPKAGSWHRTPGYEYICDCVWGFQYEYCVTETGSEEGDTYCYAIGEHNDPEHPDCDDVTIDWEAVLGGTVYSQLCNTDPP